MYETAHQWPFLHDRKTALRFAVVVLVAFALLALIDAPVTVMVASLPAAVRDPFHIITRPGNSDWIFIPAIVLAVAGSIASVLLAKASIWQRRARLIAAVSGFVIVGVGLPGILALLIKRLVGRARPVNFEQFGAFHFDPFRDWSFQSFPSGDTTTVFAMASVVAFFVPRSKPWLLLGAALVGLARIMLSMHFPTDVLGGVLLGTFGAFAARNFYLARGWLFARNGKGDIVPVISWPSDPGRQDAATNR